ILKTEKFSGKDAIKFGWYTTKNNIVFFVFLLIVYGALNYIPTVIAEQAKEISYFLQFNVQILGLILRVIMAIGFLKILLKFLDGKSPQIVDLFSYPHLFFKYLGARILYSVMIFAGFILLIIPGVVLSLKFFLYNYCVVDQDLGPIRALKQSSTITEGLKLSLFVFLLKLAGINILGFLAFGVGLFFTLPLTSLAIAYVYRELEESLLGDFSKIEPAENTAPPVQPVG
ncbi:MAG: DUF975 family protein, partial [Elusimicrobiota bacterium]